MITKDKIVRVSGTNLWKMGIARIRETITIAFGHARREYDLMNT